MSSIVKAADAAQFLSLVPRMLGFHPRQSLVVIPFDGSTSLGAMRFDLPGLGAEVDRFAATIIGMVCRLERADGLAAIAFTDDAAVDAELPHADLSTAIEVRADACGLRVVDLLTVTPEVWGSFYEDAPPRPVADLGHDDDAGDQQSGATLPEIDDALIETTTAALEAFGDAVRILCGPEAAGGLASAVDSCRFDPTSTRVDPQALAAVCRLDDLPEFFESVTGWDAASATAYDLAALAWCLRRPALRDIALVQWSEGMSAGDEALDGQLRWEAGEEYPTHLAMRVWGEGERPDAARLARVLDVVRMCAAATPPSAQPGALATAAWVSWALGKSTHADVYARRACEIEPEHGLAEIVRSFVTAGHLPDWAFRR